MNVTLLFLLLAFDPQADGAARAAVAVSAAKNKPAAIVPVLDPFTAQPVPSKPVATKRSGKYAEAWQKAVRRQRPLAIFVGQPAREVLGCVTVGLKSYRKDATVRVVVARWDDGKLLIVKNLLGKPTEKQIIDAINGVEPKKKKTKKRSQFVPQFRRSPAPRFMGGGGGC